MILRTVGERVVTLFQALWKSVPSSILEGDDCSPKFEDTLKPPSGGSSTKFPRIDNHKDHVHTAFYPRDTFSPATSNIYSYSPNISWEEYVHQLYQKGIITKNDLFRLT